MRACAGGVEQAQGAVAVEAAEAGGVVALAAAVGAGDVGEGEVDEGVGRRQARRVGSARSQRDVRPGPRPRGVTRWPAAPRAGTMKRPSVPVRRR